MPFKIFQVDTFTNEVFKGNPAAVCILDETQTGEWMQHVAAEMNLSETAFLIRRQDDDYGLRWFTPVSEVNLCGHATLASAHVLWEEKAVSTAQSIRFQTRSGCLTARKRGEWIDMIFPADTVHATLPPEALLAALGVQPVFVGKTRDDYLIEIENEEKLKALSPDFQLLSTVSSRGVIVTSISRLPGIDFVSRFFAPRYGIPEDPVTGSSHCALGPYWQNRLQKNTLVARQISRRGGILRIQPGKDHVLIGGQAVTVLQGMML